jgi:8-oxo-dGTP diphosphatase
MAARIAIAVLEHRGRWLVGTRPAGALLEGCDECPGGKLRPGEAPFEGAVRECREETGLLVEPIELLSVVEHAYPHGAVQLHFVLCRLPFEAAAPLEAAGPWRWVATAALRGLSFPAANSAVVSELERRFPD